MVDFTRKTAVKRSIPKSPAKTRKFNANEITPELHPPRKKNTITSDVEKLKLEIASLKAKIEARNTFEMNTFINWIDKLSLNKYPCQKATIKRVKRDEHNRPQFVIQAVELYFLHIKELEGK